MRPHRMISRVRVGNLLGPKESDGIENESMASINLTLFGGFSSNKTSGSGYLGARRNRVNTQLGMLRKNRHETTEKERN